MIRDKSVPSHLAMPMWKIRQERNITAQLLGSLRGCSNRKAVAVLNLATVMCEERDKYYEPARASQGESDD